jgi:phage tail-like protein
MLEFATTFNFRVDLTYCPKDGAAAQPTVVAQGGFQECSGLDLEMDVSEYLEGGRNDGVVQRIGRAKVARIILKRGMVYAPDATFENDEVWTWMQNLLSGQQLRRVDGTISILSGDRKVVGSWHFTRGLPAKIIGPQLNAKTGEVAIEELHIAHEGLRLGART